MLRKIELDCLGQRNHLFHIEKQVLGIAIVGVVDPERDVHRLRTADVEFDAVDHLVVVVVAESKLPERAEELDDRVLPDFVGFGVEGQFDVNAAAVFVVLVFPARENVFFEYEDFGF